MNADDYTTHTEIITDWEAHAAEEIAAARADGADPWSLYRGHLRTAREIHQQLTQENP